VRRARPDGTETRFYGLGFGGRAGPFRVKGTGDRAGTPEPPETPKRYPGVTGVPGDRFFTPPVFKPPFLPPVLTGVPGFNPPPGFYPPGGFTPGGGV
jgi:hypothetical protein